MPSSADPSVRPAEGTRRFPWFWLAAVVWLSAAGAGLSVLWAYDNAPGVAADAPARWPASSALTLAADRPTVVLIAHPHCSCTRATLGELAEALARAETRPKTYVVFLKPNGVPDGWEQTDLWRTARSLPDVTVLRDDSGREALRFGTATSGQTMVYDATGTLRFSGGITGASAHAGDNPGRQSLVALLNRTAPGRSATSVFGCPLSNSGS